MTATDFIINLIGKKGGKTLIIELIDQRANAKVSALAGEQTFYEETPKYYTEDTMFESPVFIARLLMFNLEKRYPRYKYEIKVRTVYQIINREEMADTWREVGVKVFHLYKGKESAGILSREEEPKLYKFIDRVMGKIRKDISHKLSLVGSDLQKRNNYYLMPLDKVKVQINHDVDLDDLLDYPLEEEPEADLAKADNTPTRIPLSEVLSDMDTLEGMEGVKEELYNICSLANVYSIWQHYHINGEQIGRFHMLFLGNPGTGKTTLAKMMGNYFFKMGILSNGRVHVHSRTDLVGRYIGVTEENMQHVFDGCRGGVLFIDEAYTLFDGRTDRSDFGNIVLQSLLPILTEPKPNMVIILAGYPNEMENMLNSNPGLKSRFPFTLQFEDYDVETLYRIGKRKLESHGFHACDTTYQLFHNMLVESWKAREKKDFANARWVENIIMHIVIGASRRISQETSLTPSVEELTLVQPVDIEYGFNKYQAILNSKRQVRRVGF